MAARGSSKNEKDSSTDGVLSTGPSFVLEGCSWGMIFYIGVYKAMVEKYGMEQLKKVRCGGSSSGCLAALCLCLGKGVDECLAMYTELAHIAEVFGVLGLMSVYHEIALRRWLPAGGEEYKHLNGRLYVNVTRFFCRSEILSDWKSNDDVVAALHASMHIPFYMTYKLPVRGAWGIDGGFSANSFKLDEKTIIITVQSKKGNIHPSSVLTSSDCFSPPSFARRQAIFEDGTKVALPELTELTTDDRIPLASSNSNSSSVMRGKCTLSLHKPMVSITRFGFCSVFWLLRLVEVAPFSIALVGISTVSYFSGGRHAWTSLGKLLGLEPAM